MVSTTEVAKYAGVSQTTVSRVLNRPEQVRKETYDKVMHALKELNYGHSVHHEPAHEPSKDILLLVGADYAGDVFSMVRELTEQIQPTGNHLSVRLLTGDETKEDFQRFIQQAKSTISIGTLPEMGASAQDIMQIEDATALETEFDSQSAANLATSYLAEQQHERIGWIGRDRSDHSERLQGYYEGLAAHQLKLRKKHVHILQHPEDFDLLAVELRSMKKPTTAFVAACYEDGAALINALKQAGHKVPKDISVISIGTPEQDTEVALTTVKPVAEKQTPIQRLIKQIALNMEGATHGETAQNELQIDNQKTVKAIKNSKKKKNKK